MTKENFTAIAVIIDASSSMAGLTLDTIGSFNQFLKEQKDVPGEASLTLCTFDTSYRLIHDFSALAKVEDLNTVSYRCNGCTALLDAMGTTIDALGARLAALPEEERPSKVIVLVVTDGEENSSRKFTLAQIKDKVVHQREVYNWEFVFMGANIDAIGAGTSLGFSAANSLQYDATAVGTAGLYSTVSSNMTSYRSSVAAGPVDFFNQVQTTIAPTPDPKVTGVVSGIDTVSVCDLSGNTKTFVFDPGNSLPAEKK